MANPQHISIRPLQPGDYELISANEVLGNDRPWNIHIIEDEMGKKDTYGYVAEADGKLAGYAIYRRESGQRQNSILRFTPSLGFAKDAASVQDALLKKICGEMVLQGRELLVVHVPNDDKQMVRYFQQSHPEFTHHEQENGMSVFIHDMSRGTGNNIVMPFMPGEASCDTTPMIPQSMEDCPPKFMFEDQNLPDYLWGSHYVSADHPEPTPCNYNPPPIEYIPQQEETDKDPPMSPRHSSIKYKPEVETALEGRRKLTEMTHMEWDVVTVDPSGKLVPLELDANTNVYDIYFRTASKIEDPKKAMGKLTEYFSQKPAILKSSQLDKSAQLTVPASWIRPVHLTLARPGMFEDSFVPAATQMRYQCKDELDEKKANARRTGTDGHRSM